MRHLTVLLPMLSLTLVGCPKKQVEQVVEQVNPGYADLNCPEGTKPTGYGPPSGLEVWCVKVTPNGMVSKHGPTILWHNNEQRKATGEFAEDLKNGGWMFWYATGKPEKQGGYVRGKEDGIWTTFHPSGERKSEGLMVDGEESGEWTYWSEDGKTRTVGKWVLGERDGTWLDYDLEDNPTRERKYRTGRLISQRELNKDE